MVVYGNGLHRRRSLNAYSVLNVISAPGGMGGHRRRGSLFYGHVLSISIRDEFAIRCRGNHKTHRVDCWRNIVPQSKGIILQ